MIEFLKPHLFKLIRRYVGYVEKGCLYQIKAHAGENELVVADDNFKPAIILLGRESYTEETLFFNIDDKKEVKNILALQREENDAFDLQKVEDKTRVSKWRLRLSNDNQDDYLGIIPISFLLAENNPKGDILELTTVSGDTLFVQDGPTGLESVMLQKSGFLNSRESFAMSIGIPMEDFERRHRQVELVEQVFSAFSSANSYRRLLIPFFKPKKLINQKKFFALVSPVVIGVVMYFSLTSGYLIWKEQQIDRQTAELSENAQLSIELKNMANDLGLMAQKATSDRNNSQPEASKSLLSILNLMDVQNIQFSRLVMYNGRYVLRGSASKATEVLTKLNENPMVTDAKFDAEVVKKYLKEDFVISFMVNPT